MKAQRIKKLMLGPSESEKVTARNSHVGMTVIADYISDEDAQRYLVFERKGQVERKPKAKPTSTRAAKTDVQQTVSQ